MNTAERANSTMDLTAQPLPGAVAARIAQVTGAEMRAWCDRVRGDGELRDVDHARRRARVLGDLLVRDLRLAGEEAARLARLAAGGERGAGGDDRQRTMERRKKRR